MSWPWERKRFVPGHDMLPEIRANSFILGLLVPAFQALIGASMIKRVGLDVCSDAGIVPGKLVALRAVK